MSHQPSSCLGSLLPFLGSFVSFKPGNEVKWLLSASLLPGLEGGQSHPWLIAMFLTRDGTLRLWEVARPHTAWLGSQCIFSPESLTFLPCCTGVLDGLPWAEGLWVFASVCKHVGMCVHMCVCGFLETHFTLFSEVGSLIEPDWLASELRGSPCLCLPQHWGYRHEGI